MRSSSPAHETLASLYTRRHDEVLVPLATGLESYIRECIAGQPRIDRISARAKDVGRFLKKASTTIGNQPKYPEPLSQIQDQIGARIVVFYKSDVARIEAEAKKYFRAIESQNVVPDSEAEFGYFGHHLVLVLPSDIIERGMNPELIPGFFELQIKTLFQHAWSEADHDLGYKPGDTPLTTEQKRLIAFTSAQAWGADHIFDELFSKRNSAA